MHVLHQKVNRGYMRIALPVAALFILTIALFHLTDSVPTIRSSIDSTLDSIKNQNPQSWYNTILQQKPYCKWEFSHYEPSVYEEKWFSIVDEAQAHICATMQEPEHAENSRKIVTRIESLIGMDPSIQWADYDTVPPAAAHPDDHLFSRMHYSRTCYDAKLDAFKPTTGRGVQLIEPLWGMLRDPFDVYCAGSALSMPGYNAANAGQSKEAILPQGFAPYTYDLKATAPIMRGNDNNHLWHPYGTPPWHSSLAPSQDAKMGTVFEKPQNIFMDLGASYFGEWGGAGRVGSSVAASGRYFYDTYHARGHPFNKYIAVEVESLDPTIAQEQLPADLVGIYNLINAPLSMDTGNNLNTVDIIKRLAKPEDFFVLKVDIDNAPIEMPLIQTLLDDDPLNGISGLIDELMFEHHVVYSPMTGPGSPWDGGLAGPLSVAIHGDLAYSYSVFRDLRRKAIRSHSWP